MSRAGGFPDAVGAADLAALVFGEIKRRPPGRELIDAQVTYENQLDDFKLRLSMPVETELRVVPVALDVTIPDIEHRDVVDVAHQYRLD